MKNRNQRNRGFTLAELLIVIAIIGVLVAASIPVFTSQREKAANATDVYNAKVIARQLQYYYMTNPEAYQRLHKLCKGGTYCIEISVLPSGAIYYATGDGAQDVINDMKEAIGALDSTTKNKLLKCQSRKSWAEYCVAASSWTPANKNTDSELHILYTAWNEVDYGGYKWENVWCLNNVNKTGQLFRSACGGNQ